MKLPTTNLQQFLFQHDIHTTLPTNTYKMTSINYLSVNENTGGLLPQCNSKKSVHTHTHTHTHTHNSHHFILR